MNSFELENGMEPVNEAEHLLSALFFDGTLTPEGLTAMINYSEEERAQGGKGVFMEDPDLEFRLAINERSVTIAYLGVGNMFSLSVDDAARIANDYSQE